MAESLVDIENYSHLLFGVIAIQEGLINNLQLLEALEVQREDPEKRIGVIFKDLGYLTMRQVLQILKEQGKFREKEPSRWPYIPNTMLKGLVYFSDKPVLQNVTMKSLLEAQKLFRQYRENKRPKSLAGILIQDMGLTTIQELKKIQNNMVFHARACETCLRLFSLYNYDVSIKVECPVCPGKALSLDIHTWKQRKEEEEIARAKFANVLEGAEEEEVDEAYKPRATMALANFYELLEKNTANKEQDTSSGSMPGIGKTMSMPMMKKRGIFVALYTVIGGIETVIWTDVIQTIVLLCGGILCFGCIWYKMPGGLSQIMEIANNNNKFYIGDFDWDLGRKTFWVVMFTGLVHWLREYSSDQNVIQRYLAAKSTREARKATALCACVSVPIWVFFALLGTALFTFYIQFPVVGLDEKIQRPENILPFFIIHNIPAGVAGIIIAGLLAAAMSSLDSSINAISTVTVVDIVKPYTHKERSDTFYLKTAKAIAIVTSVIMIAGAIFMTRYDKTVVDIAWILNSILGGCLVGLFLMGFFTTRIDNFSASVALGVAIFSNVYLALNSSQMLPEALRLNIDDYWVGILVNVIFIAAAYSIAIVKKSPPKNLEQLTIWTMNKGK